MCSWFSLVVKFFLTTSNTKVKEKLKSDSVFRLHSYFIYLRPEVIFPGFSFITL